jgi:two-component system sensor histidine kinase/response regulator
MTSSLPASAGWPVRPRPAPAPLRVLVADACRAHRMLVTGVLLRWQILPTLACDGAQALQIVEARDFDLLLMDLLMPVMDGVVTTARIRQFERENPGRQPLPIVAYTALDLRGETSALRRVGLNGVLTKPCTVSSLQSCLERCCPQGFCDD